MKYANKTSKSAKKILLNYLILQISTILNVLFCKFYGSKLHKNELFMISGGDEDKLKRIGTTFFLNMQKNVQIFFICIIYSTF